MHIDVTSFVIYLDSIDVFLNFLHAFCGAIIGTNRFVLFIVEDVNPSSSRERAPKTHKTREVRRAQ